MILSIVTAYFRDLHICDEHSHNLSLTTNWIKNMFLLSKHFELLLTSLSLMPNVWQTSNAEITILWLLALSQRKRKADEGVNVFNCSKD